MATYETVDKVEGAYEEVLSLQRELNRTINSEDVDWEVLVETIEEQSALMESIQGARQLNERFQNERSDRFTTIMEEIRSLRETLIEEIKERKNEVEKELDALDQSKNLLDEYQQDTGSSYHLDQTI